MASLVNKAILSTDTPEDLIVIVKYYHLKHVHSANAHNLVLNGQKLNKNHQPHK